jgi:hypothetical protein
MDGDGLFLFPLPTHRLVFELFAEQRVDRSLQTAADLYDRCHAVAKPNWDVCDSAL